MTQRASRHATFASIGRDVDEDSFFEEHPSERQVVGTSRVPLADFPRGARPGDLLHSILEQLDFTDEAALPSLTARALARFGFDVDSLCESLSSALLEVLHTPLDASGLCLSMLSPAQCRPELEFTLPILSGRAGTKERLTSGAIAQVFRRRAPGLGQAYHTALEQLAFEPVLGFLRGFIDLVFEYQGRYYLVDYKSNHLGQSAADYAPERLSLAMQEHHYTLQYHLYVVALHRFLQVRLAGYRYEQHFGGVYYLFLRGMARERGAETGVFFDRPIEDLILDLDALFEGGGE
jgi:exodeoxyribonuclease V beta subunit